MEQRAELIAGHLVRSPCACSSTKMRPRCACRRRRGRSSAGRGRRRGADRSVECAERRPLESAQLDHPLALERTQRLTELAATDTASLAALARSDQRPAARPGRRREPCRPAVPYPVASRTARPPLSVRAVARALAPTGNDHHSGRCRRPPNAPALSREPGLGRQWSRTRTLSEGGSIRRAVAHRGDPSACCLLTPRAFADTVRLGAWRPGTALAASCSASSSRAFALPLPTPSSSYFGTTAGRLGGDSALDLGSGGEWRRVCSGSASHSVDTAST